ncbi:hypothetical protein HY492_01190 [Candidatus Woesearchaeota archaeon]|nr:hypothetical protein [Candidatus Woesearchaeota archaeon]
MNLTLIITLSFFAISVILALLAQKKVFRTLNTVFTAVSLVLALASVALYLDGQHVQTQLAGEKLFVLEQDGVLLSGFVHAQDTPAFVKDLTPWRETFGKTAFETIRDGRLAFIATPDTFASIESIVSGNYSFPTAKVLAIITADDPIMMYKNEIRVFAKIPAEQQIKLPEMTADELRGLLFATLISAYFEKKTTINPLINALNTGELDVQPTFIMLWLIKHTPPSWLPYLITEGT